ncbi:uncharacterized protein [Macrobrachium rosenbergii]|uniref:uncharacterized protein n=1 Tax=Macrobrachium rosenbergii TaxID=79674 RepID=UPI0034D5EEA0
MPSEPSIADIRAWHGLVNQLAPFMATAPVMAPFRDLLKKPSKKKVYWDDQLQRELDKAKSTICQLAKEGLRYYDKSWPTATVTDWCGEGIGFVVLQQYCSCVTVDTPFCCKGGWRLMLCGNRHLTSTEVGYAAVEGEALAPEDEDLELSDDLMVAMVTTLAAALEVEVIVVMDQENVVSAARDDLVYQLLLTRVYNGEWPQSKSQELECLKPFFGVRERLAVSSELITYTYDQGYVRLVIPESLRQQVAANMHRGHQGLDSMLRKARQLVYWPGITGDLEHQRQSVMYVRHTPHRSSKNV